MAPETTNGAGWRIRVSPNPVRQTLKTYVLQKLHLWLCLRNDVSISITLIWFCCLFCVIIDFVLNLMDIGLQVFVHAGLLCNENFLKSRVLSKCFDSCCYWGLWMGLSTPPLCSIKQWELFCPPSMKTSQKCCPVSVPPSKLVYQLDAGFQGPTSSG